MNKMPLVSIVMPTFKARYFEEALLSAMNQTYGEVEIFISDDCPCADIQEIVERHVENCRMPVRYVRNCIRLGDDNLTQCIVGARGEYVKFLNDDDVLMPDCVERMMDVFLSDDLISLVTSRRTLIDEEGRVLPDILPTHCPFDDDVVLHPNDLIGYLADKPMNFIGEPSTVLFRRADLLGVQPNIWSLNGVTIRAIGDLAIYVNVLRSGGHLAYLISPLSCFRLHAEQNQKDPDLVRGASRDYFEFTEQIKLLKLYLPRGDGIVRCRSLVVGSHWHESPLSSCFVDPNKRISLKSPGGIIDARGSERYLGLKVGVVFYVYYPDLWGEFKLALDELYFRADFFITTVPEHADEVRRLLSRDFPRAKLFIFENRGRDFGQLFSLLENVDLERYDYVLKLHTKKFLNLLGGEGGSWRRHVLNSILPVGRLNEVFDYFAENPDVGLVGPKELLLSVKEFPGGNYSEIVSWGKVLGFDLGLMECEFFAGAMFWVRGAVLKKIRSVGIKQQDFESESARLDDTLAHVIERLISLAAKVIDLRVVPLLLPSREAGASYGVVDEWRRSRTILGLDKRLVEDYFNAQVNSPVFAILILDFVGDALQLADTVQSLSRYNFIYPHIKIFIFSESIVELVGYQDGLVFVQVDFVGYVTALNSVVDQGGFDWLMLVRAGEEFTKYGLMMAAQEIINNSDCRALFGDEYLRLADGTLAGSFRPSFNFDLLLSFPAAMTHHWLFRRDIFLSAGGFNSSYKDALEFDLLLRLIEQGGLSGFGHVDEPLVITEAPQLVDNFCEKEAILRHLQVRGYQAEILAHLPGRYRIAYNHNAQPLISIIVPTKDQLAMLQRCVESLLEKTRYLHYELLIVDNDSEEVEAREWLAAVEHMGEEKVRVLRYPHPFNYSAINNMAAREARGEYLVLLNNDTAIISESWLDELLNHAQRPEVGIVGAKLLHADGTIQHGGIILGLRGANKTCGPAQHPFVGEGMDAPGFMNRLQVDQNYSAVTAACLMIRKSIYEEVDGLDEENFKVSYNDVDLCLKVGDLGYLTVWTPHAVVMHEGSVSQKQVDPASLEAKHKRFVAEQNAMYAKWLPKLANDPAYNANLALNGPGFTLETNTDLTWRPLAWRPLPVVLAHNADPWGCGNYRIIKPHKAMRDEGLIDGAVADRLLEPAELLRLSPDVVVYQRQTKSESLESMARSRKFSAAFKVYELDDYLPNTPIKSAHRSMMSKDLVKLLRKGLGYVDRFVVSTPSLANALSNFHSDIRVVENRLPLDWWGQLALAVNTSTKPRVGWAGGVGHQGDLELIADVVRDLAGEVDWVFFGMCPENLRPYVAEYVSGIDIQLYPEKLASLRLDLALAPLENNLFNACKSNLRLLEYGICAYPVIASDIECYRGGLPVTLVKNRYRDWMEAIRSHLADRQALAARGLLLREAIQRDWMLTGACLETWRDAWLPD